MTPIDQVDAMTDSAAAYFMVNCAHPTHFMPALAHEGAWRQRIVGLRANSSRRSHAELDERNGTRRGRPARARRPARRAAGSGSCGPGARRVLRHRCSTRGRDRLGVEDELGSCGMPALDAIADWPVSNAAAAVVGPSGVLAEHGDVAYRFGLASVTKPLVARAVQIAIEEGVLELDTPAGPPGSTVRHLLAHASGYAMHTDRVMSEPGKRRIYSNYGFGVVASVVASEAGIDFDRYLDEAVFDPLGMTSSGLEGGAEAAGYGATSTVADLALFVGDLLRPVLVSAEMHAEATAVQFPG